MNSLIVGGTSGLGLEIAKNLKESGHKVYITGRHKPSELNQDFVAFDLSAPDLVERINNFVLHLPKINTLVYSAGYFQDGRITDLTEQQIEEMLNVGGRGLIYFIRAILKKQNKLDELITITSTSAWTPRQREPIYNFVKSGASHFSNAMAEDGRISRVLVVGPAGMKTKFWSGVPRDDLDRMLDPIWTAHQIMDLRHGEYKYIQAKIMREPARVELVETR